MLLLRADINRHFLGFATVKNIAGYRRTSKPPAASVIVHDRRTYLPRQIIHPQDISASLGQGVIGLRGLGVRRPCSIANPTSIQDFYLKKLDRVRTGCVAECVVLHTRRCIGRLYFSLPPSISRFEILPRPASQTLLLRRARGSLTMSSSLVIESAISSGRGIFFLPFNQSSLRALK